jgi:hypothetical protein
MNKLNWYQSVKQSSTMTDLIEEKDNKAVKFNGRVFVAKTHQEAWRMAEEKLGQIITDMLDANAQGVLDLTRWESNTEEPNS